MRLFLDTSVILSACLSSRGASNALFRFSQPNQWRLLCTPFVIHEVERNLHVLPADAELNWASCRPSLEVVGDIYSIEQPCVFESAKDKPILFSALAWADVLLTLDQADFIDRIGNEFYGLAVLRPGAFLLREREAYRLIEE